ncbi:ribonuclease T2 [Cladorrhinum samala]|uniref:Ribonuclease T2 n=1 Tax=Cladorrhinum samala TaxID=585594 RepID=A0AAV9HUM4_9PEZI|nr:ribonuclease T2 [Cladorrhinum samala]
MPSTLPVPSKAALTVLRGLALGTSCTIALIVEDRRRRINNAVRAISNGDRIKSCRKYHPGGRQFAAAGEQEEIFDTSLPKPSENGGDSSPRSGRRKQTDHVDEMTGTIGERGETVHNSNPSQPTQGNENDPFEALTAATAAQSSEKQKLKPFEHPKIGRKGMPTWSNISPDAISKTVFPSNEQIIAKVHYACQTKDDREIAAATQGVLEAFKHKVAPNNQDEEWVKATALLCRTSQDFDRIEDAAAILAHVVDQGPLTQAQFLSHGAIPLLKSLIAQANSSDAINQGVLRDELDKIAHIFLAKYTIESPPPELFKLGCQLLEMADRAGVVSVRSTRYLFQRCNYLAIAGGNPSHDMTLWFITKLHGAQDYISAVQTFLCNYQMAPRTAKSINEVAFIVIDCVEKANGYRPDHVFKALLKLCLQCKGVWSEGRVRRMRLKEEWIIRLFESHWKRYHKFEEIEALFDMLQPEEGLVRTAVGSAGVFRIMTELALENGDEAKAQFFFDCAIALGLVRDTNFRMLGIYAKHHARKGEWEKVRAMFERMEVDENDPKQRDLLGRVFVPVLKAFSDHHTVYEVDNFMRIYVDELRVPLDPFLVTLMAKEYAKLRDVDSIVNWLDHCAHVGFKVDAGFSNAILVNIRKHWNMPFNELRTLFRKLRELSPDFVDEHTEQVMADAALTSARYSGVTAAGRLASLRLSIRPSNSSKTRHYTNKELIEGMREHLVCGRPMSAYIIYKKTTGDGRLPFHRYVLRLALKALVQVDNKNFTRAYQLVRKCKAMGNDVTDAVNYLLAIQVGELKFGFGEAALPAVRETLEGFRKGGVELTHEPLMLAAFTCLKARQPHAATEYALEAAKAKGAEPCYSLRNFKVLVISAAMMGNVDMLKEVLERGLQSSWREDNGVLSALKEARLRLRQATYFGAVGGRSEGHRLINWSLRFLTKQREKLREGKERFDHEALEIMKQAALDAGREPVDFDDIPWLGGGKDNDDYFAGGGGGGSGGGEDGLPFSDGLSHQQNPAAAATAAAVAPVVVEAY